MEGTIDLKFQSTKLIFIEEREIREVSTQNILVFLNFVNWKLTGRRNEPH